MTRRRDPLTRLAAGMLTSGASLALALAAFAAAPVLAQKAPDETVKGLTVPDGLEVTLWAAEPMLVNPTNIDVDAKGRVWVLEAANYRGSFKPWGMLRPEGDRILILEDADNDGKADKQTVFYQGKDLQAPLGICVLGDKVVVAQSPKVMVFTIDASGDKPTGEPEVVLSGFTGVDHDHGVHAGIFGPDGRFYFNAGNDGMRGLVLDADGKPVVDVHGSELGGKAKQYRGRDKPKGELGFQDGHAFRADPDLKNVEVLAHNFRNNYELTVDSFGTIWQSDNDDDGNQSVRINFVMEGGNYGFKGPKGYDWKRDSAGTGAAAQPATRPAAAGKAKPAADSEAASPLAGQTKQEAHWHLRWPGVVPNVLHTGGGSPTGITVYEGDLLPEPFRGALIHCDAGPNVVRAYVTSPSSSAPTGLMDAGKALAGATDKGAGYKAVPLDLVKADDKWFRPADVCVAPDGSLFVADWYDPGVGGHNMQDKDDPAAKNPTDWKQFKGRVYRIAPKGHQPATPKLNLTSVGGQIAGLLSPNFAVRYLAYNALRAGVPDANKALADLYQRDPNPRMRARALWLLARTPDGKRHVESALKDEDEDIRIAGLRAARLIKMDVSAVARSLLGDASMGVLREVAVAMNYEPAEKAVPILVKLAERYDGEDRWYLEALGIGATGKEEQFLDAWSAAHKETTPAAEKLAWRMRKVDPTAKPTDKTAGGAGAPRAEAEGRRPF